MLMRSRVGLLVAVAVLVAACGSTRFPRDAAATLEKAAARSAAGRAAIVNGSMSIDGTQVVLLSGALGVRDREASIRTADATRPAKYPPYESRFVDGWSYVQIDSAVQRPRLVKRSVNWIAFQARPTHPLPVPDRTMLPTAVFDLFDRLRSQPILDAHFVAPDAHGPVRVALRLPALPADPSLGVTETVSIDAHGRIAQVDTVTRFVQQKHAHEQDDTYSLEWVDSTPAVAAPPDDEVQRLSPGENLYPPAPSTTTTVLPMDEPAVAANHALFDALHAQIQANLPAPPDLALTSYAFDAATNTIDVVYAHRGQSQSSHTSDDTVAWRVSNLLADTFWSPDLVLAVQQQHIDPEWLPKLHIAIDGVVYRCPTAVQIEVGGNRVAERDWLSACTG